MPFESELMRRTSLPLTSRKSRFIQKIVTSTSARFIQMETPFAPCSMMITYDHSHCRRSSALHGGLHPCQTPSKPSIYLSVRRKGKRTWKSLARKSPLQKSKDRKRDRTEQRGQLMPDVSTTHSYHPSDWTCIPSDFHTQCGTRKSKCKSYYRSPSKWQCVRASPCIPVVIVPIRTTEYDVFFYDDNEVDNSPVANNR